MGSFVKGSVASFRIPDSFQSEHLDYLNALGGRKSTKLAKYCLIGLKAELDDSIIINGTNLPLHIREWLSKNENVELLVNVLNGFEIDSTVKEKSQKSIVVNTLKDNESKSSLVQKNDNNSFKNEVELPHNQNADAVSSFITNLLNM